MFQIKIVEKIKTHFTFNFFFENSAVYEIMWKNMVQPRVISGIRRDVDEICALLGYYTA